MNRRQFVAAAAATPLALSVAPSAAARRLGGNPVALVTADLESHVAAVELSSGRVLRRIRTLPGPRSIESALQTTAIVAHTTGGALTLIDGPSLRVRAVIRGLDEPRYTAVDRAGRFAYVSDSALGALVTVDLVRARVVDRTELGGPARHLSLHRSGRLLWTSLGTKAERVAVVSLDEPARPRLETVIRPPFLAHDVGFAPGGKTIWMTSGDRGEAAIYDVRSGRLLRRLGADRPPQHVTFTRGAAYVTSGDDGLLRVHSLGGRLRRTERVPGGSYNVQHDGGVILTPSLSQGTLCIVGRDGRVQRRVEVARSSHDACFVVSGVS